LQSDALAVFREPANLKIGFEYPKPKPSALLVGLLHGPSRQLRPQHFRRQGITPRKPMILLTFPGDRRFSEKVVGVH
jgi:hypothetical protein